jgi:hypothetical protein
MDWRCPRLRVLLIVLLAPLLWAGCRPAPAPVLETARLSPKERECLGRTLEETKGSFAYSIPRDWEFMEMDDSQFRVAVGPRINGYVSNIRVSRELAPSKFEYYVDQARKELGRQALTTGVEEDTRFVTVSGIVGRRWITHTFQSKERIWHAYYLFPGPGDAKIVVTVSAAQSDALRMGFVADSCMKTMVIR